MNDFILKSAALELKKEHGFLDVFVKYSDRTKLYVFFEHNGFVLSAMVPIFLHLPKNIFSELIELKGFILLHMNFAINDFDKTIFNNDFDLSSNHYQLSEMISNQLFHLSLYDSNFDYTNYSKFISMDFISMACAKRMPTREVFINTLKRFNYSTLNHFGKEFYG